LFIRAVIAFLLCPGTVGYVVPLWLAPAQRGFQWPGAALVAAGSFMLLRCVRDFYVAGKGTLAPWAPPERLVMVGLYRWSRNPMYVSVLIIVCGWTLWFSSRALLLYAIGLAVAFHLRIVLYEEPRLHVLFDDEWLAYRQRVSRWLGRASSAKPRGSRQP
jgi:protein-S-isoprenylcysteine O-methyltransferase Ste14